MVVARKAPVAPAPTGSRSTSTQQLPKSKSQPLPQPKPAPPSQSDKDAAANARKLQEKAHNHARNKSSSWSRRVFLFLLGFFTVYAFSICPNDFPRTSSVCHSLDLYRTHILDPYLVPPIQSLLHHAEPHFAPLKPYVAPTVVYTRTHIAPRVTAIATYVTRQFQTHVAPAYNQYIVHDLWELGIKPRYYAYVHAKVYPHAQPYIIYYRYRLRPALRAYSAHAADAYTLVRPHAARAGAHAKVAYQGAKKHTCKAYKVAKPHVQAAYIRARPHAIKFGESVRVHAVELLRVSVEARRVYVDPHVMKIWEKATETKGESNDTTAATTTFAEESPSTVAVSATQEPSAPVSVPVPQATLAEVEETATVSPAVVPASEPSPVPANEPEAASVVAESLHPGSVGVAAQEPSAETSSAATEDVNDFLQQLGISEDPPPSDQQPLKTSDEAPEEEEQAHLPSEPKVDREHILARHSKWENELKDLVSLTESELRGVIEEIRQESVKEIAKYGSDKGKHEQIGVVGVVEEEAGRFVKGLEGYLKGAEKRVGKKQDVDREQRTWWKVLEKTEEKFSEKVGEVQQEVHAWYVSVREQERDEVEKATTKVKAFAENAQGDLGLDYAWLQDVTYNDWQRYHDLIRVSENFTILAHALQSGEHTHPAAAPAHTSPLSDVLLNELSEVEREVSEIVEGFAAMVADVGRRAGRMFEAAKEGFEREEKEKEVKEEEVKILPIEEKKAEGVEGVFVGRSKEEVEGKLKAAGVGVETRDEL